MKNICVAMNEEDLKVLMKLAEYTRIPYSTLARGFIVKGLREVEEKDKGREESV